MKRFIPVLFLIFSLLTVSVPVFAQGGQGQGAVFYDVFTGDLAVNTGERLCFVSFSTSGINDFIRVTEEGTFMHVAEKSLPLTVVDPMLGTMTGTGAINVNAWISGATGNVHIKGNVTDASETPYRINCLLVIDDGIIQELKIDIK